MLMECTKSLFSALAATQKNFKMLENPKCDQKCDLHANLNTTGAIILPFYETVCWKWKESRQWQPGEKSLPNFVYTLKTKCPLPSPPKLQTRLLQLGILSGKALAMIKQARDLDCLTSTCLLHRWNNRKWATVNISLMLFPRECISKLSYFQAKCPTNALEMHLRANPTVVLWQNSCSGFQAAHCQMTGAATLCLIGFQCSSYQGSIQQLAWRWLNTSHLRQLHLGAHQGESPAHTIAPRTSQRQHWLQMWTATSIFFPISTINKLIFGSGSKIAGGKQIFSTMCTPSMAHCCPAVPAGWHNGNTHLGWAWGQKAYRQISWHTNISRFKPLHHFQALIFYLRCNSALLQ